MSTPEEAAVLNTANSFLRGIKARDKATMMSLILPSGAACLIREDRDTKTMQPLHMSLQAVVDRIPFDGPLELDEQAYNSKVLVDGELAMAWTPYAFYEGTRLNHTGTNIFTLWKKESKWLITGVSDIAREEPKDD